MKKLFTTLLFFPALLFATPKDTTQVVEKKIYNTLRIPSGQVVNFDGQIEDPVWENVEWGMEFKAQEPNTGEAPKQLTQFKILYDDQNIYVAFLCLDSEPEKIENRLSRRDRFPGDWVEIHFGSYNDQSTAFSFTTSVSGVRGDEFVTQNGNNWDENWNPVWAAKTNIDEKGWTAEIKIPLSQLRYGNDAEQVWALNVMRRDFREDERSTWQWIPQNASGWISNYGELHGIKNVKPKRQVEIMPYVLAKAETYEQEAGNPFRDGNDVSATFGLDGKVGLTSDITLDFTINPDFGQVEADPSQLNLNGFQIFFNEQRPFFVENANLFNFRVTQAEAGGPYNIDNLFYSRRIGQRPRGSHELWDNAYSNTPNFTSIVGAAKVSGKTKKGLSIGILESITAEEKIDISTNGDKTQLVAEPLTNYFVGRIAQDFNEGATVIAGTLTSVSRRLEDTGLTDQFHSDAMSGGMSVFHSWKDREWQIRGNMAYSNVKGSAAKIEETQRAFEHYFQRPDADHLNVDPNKTSLSGHAGTFTLANYWGDDNISFQTGMTWRSPEFEINDIGFLNNADEISHFTWAGYRVPKPFGIVRRFQININEYNRWTYGKEHIYTAYNMNAHLTFTNTWGISSGFNLETKDISPKALFGGPLLRQNKGMFKWVNIRSDNRKKWNFGIFYGNFHSINADKGALSIHNGNLFASIQPTDALSISINPRYFKQDRAIQNVSYEEYNGEDRYVTGRVNQETFSLSTRINYSVTPNLSIQYWGQPFISKGTYSEYKYITDRLAVSYQDRFQLYDESQISHVEEDGGFTIDEDRDGITDYSFDSPDFNFLQFRSNLVLRWEYKPGSEFFLVWTQSTNNNTDTTKGIFDALQEDLFTEKINNIFLMKFTHRFLNT